MASISATYPGGGYRTDVSGGGGFQPGGGEDMGWLMDLARRRAEQKTRAGAYDLMAQREMLKAMKPKPQLATAQSAYGTPMEQAVRREQGLADIAQAKAVSGVVPQKFISLGMGEGGYIPDERRMSGAQRGMFLPQNSQFTGEPTPLDIERGTAAGIRGTQAGEQEGIRQMLALLAGSQPGFGGSLR